MSAHYQPLSPLTLPLTGMRLIEASAGTGKTYTIAALYLRLVLGHGEAGPDQDSRFGRALSPREILVVTFTRAAVEELRDRIRARLQDAAHVLRLDTPPPASGDAILAALYAWYEVRGERLQAVHVLQQAAEGMDEAAIFTIHGWCQQVLQQHAFESGAGFNRSLQQDEKILLETCVQDYWRTFFYPLSLGQVQWMRSAWKTPDALLQDVRNTLRHHLVGDPDDAPALMSQWFQRLQTLQAQCLAQRESLLQWVDAVIAADALNKQTYKPDTLRVQLQYLLQWSELPEPHLLEHSHPQAKSLEWWAWTTLAPKLKKGKIFTPLNFFIAIDEVLDLFNPRHLKVHWIKHATSWVNRRMAQEKQRLASMHFDDLVNDVYFALTSARGARLAEVLRTRFPVGLIDEFQDTDDRQYAAFNAVYAQQSDSGLLLIGDPKQAIYSFRGADIFTYLQARMDTQGRHYSLDTNFRSTPTLVAAINHLFDMPRRSLMQAPFVFEGIPFVPVSAVPAKVQLQQAGATLPALTFWHLAEPKADKNTYKNVMAAQTADYIASLLNDAAQGTAGFLDMAGGMTGDMTPLRAADMAILVRNRHEAGEMRTALAARGVRSVYLSERDTVFATDEARTVLVWLQAVASPEEEALLRAALAEPQLRLTLAELDRLQQDELFWEAKIQQFKDLRQHWQQHGVLPMLRRLLQDFAVPHHLLAEPGGERILTNLLHLSEWLQTAASTLEGERALIRHLHEKIRQIEQADDNDEHTLRLESDEQLLKIITIHKSKGLEYPLVFLPFVCLPPREPRLPYVFRDAAGHKQIYWDDGDDVAKTAACAYVYKELLAEEMRLLYVALTRAKYACWLGMAAIPESGSKKEPNRFLKNSPLAWLLGGRACLAPGELAQHLAALVASCPSMVMQNLTVHSAEIPIVEAGPADTSVLADARQMMRKVAQGWSITSYTGIVWGASSDEAVAADVLPLLSPPFSPQMPQDEVLTEERMSHPLSLMQDVAPPASPTEIPQGLHAFPAGAKPGTFLHEILEWMANEGFARFLQASEDAELAAAFDDALLQRCEQRDFAAVYDIVSAWLKQFVKLALPVPNAPPLVFGQLQPAHYQTEMEFWMALDHLDQQALDRLVRESEFPDKPRPALQARTLEGMLKGFIDLLCCHDGRYYVLDYKSNRLGVQNQDYTQEALCDAVLHHRYDVQYALYTLALHRLLKARLGDGYRYEQHMGGALYLFLRGLDAQGHGVFFRRLPYATVLALEASLGGSPCLA